MSKNQLLELIAENCLGDSVKIKGASKIAVIEDSNIISSTWKMLRPNSEIFTTPEEFLSYCAKHDNAMDLFDILVVDNNFESSDMTGIELAPKARELLPRATILLSTNGDVCSGEIEGLFVLFLKTLEKV